MKGQVLEKVIRPLAPADFEPAAALVRAGLSMPDEELATLLRGHAVVFESAGHIVGCGAVACSNGGGRTRAEVGVYVAPAERNHGIGRRLWEAVWPEVERAHPARVVVHYRSDDGGAADHFFTARGLRKVVDTLLMEYEGPAFGEPAVGLLPYTDAEFADYLCLNNEGFAQVRRDVGLEPEIFGAAAFEDQMLRTEVHAKAGQIWLFRVEGALAGFVEVAPPFIESVALTPAFQGKGYGPGLTRFAVDRVKAAGHGAVQLHVGAPNDRAWRMYERLGFRRVQTMGIAMSEVGR